MRALLFSLSMGVRLSRFDMNNFLMVALAFFFIYGLLEQEKAKAPKMRRI